MKSILLSEFRKPFQLLINAFPDSVMLLNKDGCIVFTNTAQELFVYYPEDKIQEIVDLVLKGNKAVTLLQHRPNQSCLMMTGTPVLNSEGDIAFILIYSKDINKIGELHQQFRVTEQLTQGYSKELNELGTQKYSTLGMVVHSKEMRKVVDLAIRVAKVDTTILISGESGVGKELYAKTIHEQSTRKLGPFIKINCSAIPESLIESELFGYEPGTFTGGKKEGKPGLFELADNGDMFLDEIGELPLSLQPKLLRVLQEREITRLGGAKPRKIDVRIIAATNKDLRELVKRREFREDLFFRLNVIPIRIPPLRERKNDIIPLVYHFMDYYSEKHNLKKEFSGTVLNLFLNYDWPGNVRELQNVIERMLVISNDTVIEPEHIPSDLLPISIDPTKSISVHKLLPMKEAIAELESQLIKLAMNSLGSTSKAAEILDIHQTTVIRKLHKLGIFTKQTKDNLTNTQN